VPGWLDKVVDYAVEAVSPERGKRAPSQIPRDDPGWGGYFADLARSFDPRSPAGIANLATSLFPFKLSPSMKLYLAQMQTHKGGGPLTPRTKEWLESIGVGPEWIERRRGRYYTKPSGYYPLREEQILADPGALAIADLLGMTHSPPMNTLLDLSNKDLGSRWDEQASTRLGLTPSSRGSIAPAGAMNVMNPNSKLLLELIARSNINRRN